MNWGWPMSYVIAEPCIEVKDTACVDACPVDCIHPKKKTTYDDGRPGFEEVPQIYIDPRRVHRLRRLRARLSGVRDFCVGRSA
jgi:NAD-dependent dihydropyrimidine dehydrogenase PreA subunit